MIDPKIDQTILDTYSNFVLSTYAPGMTTEQSISNCTLSMLGELAEWDNTVSGTHVELLEAGDVLYYLTQLLRELEIPVSFLNHELSFADGVSTLAIVAKISDRTKKHLYWGPNPKYNRNEYIKEMKPILINTLRNLTMAFDLQSIIEANIDKLSKRKGVDNPLRGCNND